MFGLAKLTLEAVGARALSHAARAMAGLPRSRDGLAAGIVAGTRIATSAGSRRIEAITEGDEVLTFDSGLKPVRAVIRGPLWAGRGDCPQALWPLYVPPGALGNVEAIAVLPEQTILVESDTADLLLDDPFTLLKAPVLAGFRGIERAAPPPGLEAIHLVFDRDEVVFAANGALFLCACAKTVTINDVVDGRAEQGRYRALSGEEAQLLIECMEEEDDAGSGKANAA